MSEESNRRGPVVLLVGVVAATLIVGGLYVAARLTPAPAPVVEEPLPMGDTEQAYVPQIQFLEPKVRARPTS